MPLIQIYVCARQYFPEPGIWSMQFVFAITEAMEPIVGGHVWRSDNYGREGSWKDVTVQMEGGFLVYCAQSSAVLTLSY